METTALREYRARIGEAIRRLRKEEGISALFLAKVLGVTQPTISRIERGISSISAEALCLLAQSYHRPLSYFVGEESSISVGEEDVLRAGLAFYGARQIRAKRTIDLQKHYRTYSEFLNAALAECDDPRIAAALATTLYQQAAQKKLKPTPILSTVNHERLIANLKALIQCIIEARLQIERPATEKKLALDALAKLAEGLPADVPAAAKDACNLTPQSTAEFINASIGDEA